MKRGKLFTLSDWIKEYVFGLNLNLQTCFIGPIFCKFWKNKFKSFLIFFKYKKN